MRKKPIKGESVWLLLKKIIKLQIFKIPSIYLNARFKTWTHQCPNKAWIGLLEYLYWKHSRYICSILVHFINQTIHIYHCQFWVNILFHPSATSCRELNMLFHNPTYTGMWFLYGLPCFFFLIFIWIQQIVRKIPTILLFKVLSRNIFFWLLA